MKKIIIFLFLFFWYSFYSANADYIITNWRSGNFSLLNSIDNTQRDFIASNVLPLSFINWDFYFYDVWNKRICKKSVNDITFNWCDIVDDKLDSYYTTYSFYSFNQFVIFKNNNNSNFLVYDLLTKQKRYINNVPIKELNGLSINQNLFLLWSSYYDNYLYDFEKNTFLRLTWRLNLHYSQYSLYNNYILSNNWVFNISTNKFDDFRLSFISSNSIFWSSGDNIYFKSNWTSYLKYYKNWIFQKNIWDLYVNTWRVIVNQNLTSQYCRTELLNFQYPTLYDDVFNNSELVNNPNDLHSDKTKVINYLSDYSYSSWIITWKINWSIWSPINYEENQWLVISTHNTKLQWITINWSHSDFDYFYLAYQDQKTLEPKRLKPLENWWSWRRFKFSDDIINLRWYEELVDTFVYIIFENTKFNSTYQINNLKLYQYSPQFYDTKVCYKINLSDYWLKTDSNNNIIDENWKKYDINKKWELVDENGKIITQIKDINYNWEDKKIEDIYDYNWQLEQEIKNEIEDEKKQIDNEFIKKIFWENWSIILTSLVDQLTFDSEKIKENTIKNVPIPNIENNKLNYDTKIDIKVQMPKPITIHYKARTEPNAWELSIVTILCILFIIFKAFFIVIYFLPLITISKFSSFILQYILPSIWSNNYWWNGVSLISYVLYFSSLALLFYLLFAFIFPFYSILSLVQNSSWIFLYNISLFFNWWDYFLWLLQIFFHWIYTVIILYIWYILTLKFARVN